MKRQQKYKTYIFISGKIEGTDVSILNVYIPPGSKITTYRKIFMSQATGILICGGDCNIRINPRLNSSKMSTITPTHKRIKTLMSELGVIDLWRDFHPTERDYTHYSNPHNVYSSIDVFIFKRDRFRVHQCEHGNIDLSDHAPISLTIQISNDPKNTQWKLNSSIFNDQKFKTQMKKELEHFFFKKTTMEKSQQKLYRTH